MAYAVCTYGKKATPLCPCGWAGDPSGRCRCHPDAIQRYRAKIPCPLLERIDLHLEVPRLPPAELRPDAPSGESSEMVSPRVVRVHAKYNGNAPAAATHISINLKRTRSADSRRTIRRCWRTRSTCCSSRRVRCIASCAWRGRLRILRGVPTSSVRMWRRRSGIGVESAPPPATRPEHCDEAGGHDSGNRGCMRSMQRTQGRAGSRDDAERGITIRRRCRPNPPADCFAAVNPLFQRGQALGGHVFEKQTFSRFFGLRRRQPHVVGSASVIKDKDRRSEG